MTDEEFLKKISEKIHVLRIAKGISRNEMAAKMGWKEVTAVNRMESGKHASSIIFYRKVAKVLGVELSDLISEK